MSKNMPHFLLLPGLMCSSELFASQIPLLWKYGSVTIANHTGYDDMQRLAQKILEFAPSKFIPIGLSMGGYLVLEMYRQAPSRIQGCVLMDTSARPDTPEGMEGRKDKIKQVEDGYFNEIVSSAYPAFVAPIHKHDNELRDTYERMAHDAGAVAYVNQQKAIMSRLDSRAELSLIHVPTLIIIGEQDTLIPYEHSEELAQGITGSQLTIIPNCGHLSAIEQPQLVNTAIEYWLQTAFKQP